MYVYCIVSNAIEQVICIIYSSKKVLSTYRYDYFALWVQNVVFKKKKVSSLKTTGLLQKQQ